ncbi:MAG: tRNA pseudouridine(55) synthase TruB [Evtepia sp.]
MLNGILIIDKPSDWTSHDVVAKLRHLLHEKRIGHAGTLDPMATGVLPVFIGRATRAVAFAAEREKEYFATIRLGIVTDTQDITGSVLESYPVSISKEQVEAVLGQFRGEILQIPPMYSAIKRDGKKLYELARAGKSVYREPRPITIYELELLDQLSDCDFSFRVICSKGTYIRTLCHDIGARLGCGGTLLALRRSQAAGFTLAQSVTMEQVSNTAPNCPLLPIESYFSEYPALIAPQETIPKILNGASFQLSDTPDGTYRVFDEAGHFLMLGKAENGLLCTVKSFFEV